MGEPDSLRITGPMLHILELFLRAWQQQRDLDGWRIMSEARLAGPTVYRVLDKLEDRGWIAGRWSVQSAPAGRPRVRLYSLTPTGSTAVQYVVSELAPELTRARWRPTRPGLAHPAHRIRPV